MKLSEAIAQIEQGNCVISPAGSKFWLTKDTKDRPVLMCRPHGFSKDVKHVVIASEHFNSGEWTLD